MSTGCAGSRWACSDRNTAPEPIVAELEKILDSGEGGLSQNTVKFQPITRMNAILVVTRKPDMLRTVEDLDSGGSTATDTARAGCTCIT